MERNKFRSEELRNAFHESLFGRKVVVQRGDVYAGPLGNCAGTQPFKADFGDYVESRLKKGGAAQAWLILRIQQGKAPVGKSRSSHSDNLIN